MSRSRRPPGLVDRISRARRSLGTALLVALLLGCQPASPTATPPAVVAAVPESTALWGRVSAGASVQATATDLVSYASVTLLNASQQAVATGLTDAAGAFALNPFVGWTPTTNAVYVLDARKSFDRSNDQAGLRFRTIVSWDGTQWRSLAGTTTGKAGGAGVLINAQTTALAAIQSLRARSGALLLGSINPATGTFTPVAGVTASEVDTVRALVEEALRANVDPLFMLTYANSTYSLRLRPREGGLLFDLEDALLNSGQQATMVQGRDGGRAIATSGGIALYLGQFGSQGAAAGSFVYPQGLETDRFGNVYVSDYSNHRVVKFSPEGAVLLQFGSFGTANGQFNGAHDVTVDMHGNLYVTDIENHRIQKFDSRGNFLMGIGHGTVWGPATPAPAVNAGSANGWLNRPYSVEVDPFGNIFVSDQGNFRLQKFTASGQFVLGIGNGTAWGGATPAPAPAAGTGNAWFNAGPWGFVIDKEGYLYMADHANVRIQKFEPGGGFVLGIGNGTVWGPSTPAPAPAAGSGNGYFQWPDTVALDPSGNLWVTDGYEGTHNNRLQKFDRNGAYLGQYGSKGTGNGQFNAPRGITFAPDGTLLVAEWLNQRIQRFLPTQTNLSFPGATAVNRAAGTVELWAKPTWGPTTPGRNNFFELENPAAGGTNVISLFKRDDVLELYYAGSSTAAQRVFTPLTDWQPNQWRHVALSWNASNVALYLDGRLVNGLVPTAPLAMTPTLYVGHNLSPDVHFDGVIDQFRIYDYVKSPEEIARDARGLVQE